MLVLTGTAGSGKSTTALRLALQLNAAGRTVAVVPTGYDGSIADVSRAIRQLNADAVLIDDADRFGRSLEILVERLIKARDKRTVIVCMRSTSMERLDALRELALPGKTEVTAPDLTDDDIDSLIDALERGKRLGRLKGMSAKERRNVFTALCGRQLLVAMIEATSGERFDEKIVRECTELSGRPAVIYAIAVLATAHRYPLGRDQLLLALRDPGLDAMADVRRLAERGLLVVSGGNYLARHRAVAERALEFYRQNGQLASPIVGLAFALASQMTVATPRYSRERQLLNRLTNHDWLRRRLAPSDARSVYVALEDVMRDDFHYWLQRGAFDVEEGDLRSARNFLEQARGLRPDDYMVQTEWSYLALKDACDHPEDPDMDDRVAEALGQLEEAIRARGDTDSYPYHVYGNQGLAWCHHLHSSEDKRELLARLKQVVDDGARAHPRDPMIAELVERLQRAYLMTAVE